MSVIERLSELNDKYDNIQKLLEEKKETSFALGVLTGAVLSG